MDSTFALGLFIGIPAIVGGLIYLMYLKSADKRVNNSKIRK